MVDLSISHLSTKDQRTRMCKQIQVTLRPSIMNKTQTVQYSVNGPRMISYETVLKRKPTIWFITIKWKTNMKDNHWSTASWLRTANKEFGWVKYVCECSTLPNLGQLLNSVTIQHSVKVLDSSENYDKCTETAKICGRSDLQISQTQQKLLIGFLCDCLSFLSFRLSAWKL